eukprot:scaffold113801_cov57-Phaeocystis_antarctica.AAC.3
MSIGTCQTAQPLFDCCAVSSPRFLHPPPHVGVGFRHTQIAGCGRASSRHIFCPVTHASMGASGGFSFARRNFPDPSSSHSQWRQRP